MKRVFAAVVILVFVSSPAFSQAAFDLQTARLSLDKNGRALLSFSPSGPVWPASAEPAFQLETDQGSVFPESVVREGDQLNVQFPEGEFLTFAIHCESGMLLFELKDSNIHETTKNLLAFSLCVPRDAEIIDVLNAASAGSCVAAVMAAEPNVQAFSSASTRPDGDRAGCTHEVSPSDQAKEGATSMKFVATADAQPGGWSVVGWKLGRVVDLTGLRSVRAWVYGDGKGELLKIQLYDGGGGCRDTYIPITFEGWQQVTVAEGPYDKLKRENVTGINLYYNGLPPGQTATCLVDQIEAIVDRDGQEQVISLEGFEQRGSSFWTAPARTLNVQTIVAHGITPVRFGIIATTRDALFDALPRFEVLAGMPSPRPGGEWNKRSPWIKRSYLFLTSFSEPQFDKALALARRGGFDMILLGQESWCRSTGHYEVNTDRFPDGLDGLVRTFQRFRQEGFHVGLHLLGASIYPPDPYLTPVPDPRLVKDAKIELATDIDEKADFVPTPVAPEAFPAEDGGYMGAGAILQIGNELIQYGERSMNSPFGFRGCQRGILGTSASGHAKGDSIAHVRKSYGYFMFDMDTPLIDEVTSNAARIANACSVDMMYFDGSEALQGDHWYYNARLHKAFFDKLERKDVLLQASSFSHYSWHILARSASADGHGDLKGYLDERSGWFDSFKRGGMPLDIGWYYGYDPSATPDMFEYVLGATIGYDSSMSFQVSVEAASNHPFTGEILDLISRYERLRLSGRVPDDMRERLRIDPALAGEKKPEERDRLLDVRREYRLVAEAGQEAFQRISYQSWRNTDALDDSNVWTLRVSQGPARMGFQIQAMGGPFLQPGPAYRSPDALVLETFDDLAPYAAAERKDVRIVAQGEGGSTLAGVTQELAVADQDAKEGGRCAMYTATSTLDGNEGWSCIGRAFDPPLDLSSFQGIGFWLRGDGQGGAFKLQLTDGAKAADYYITNDYVGWRYHQLARPQPDPLDYAKVRTLGLYYNGLPGRKTVSCALDDVKALRTLDNGQIVNPWFEINGQRLTWQGSLEAGQYLFSLPGEPWRLYGPTFVEPAVSVDVPDPLVLPDGEYAVRFGCNGSCMLPARVRMVLEPRERYMVPAAPTR